MLEQKFLADTPFSSSCPMHLVEEINHRVVNEYAEAIAMLVLAAARSEAPHVRAALSTTAGRLRIHAAAHRTLLPPVSDGPVDLADYIAGICESFTRATLADRGVTLILKVENVLLPAEMGWRIGLVVAELIRNAARHGLRGKGGTILVRLGERDGEVTCLVHDNGCAVSDARPGRGHRLVRSLVADLDGTIRWSFSTSGSFAFLRLPVTPTWPGSDTDTYVQVRRSPRHETILDGIIAKEW